MAVKKHIQMKIVQFIKCLVFLSTLIMIQNCSPGKKENLMVFNYNQTACSSLDPAFAKDQGNMWVVNQIFNGLVQLDENMGILPSIAKSWNISDNGLVYDFYLKKDVYFHSHSVFGENNTRTVTASDFVYSFNRIINDKVGSPGAWIFNGRVDATEAFSALNDSVLRIKLTAPFPPFLGILSMQYCSVVSKEVIDLYGEHFRKNPIGTGPFKFKMWEEDQKMILMRNELYFEKDSDGIRLPYLDAVKISFIQDKQMEFLSFKKQKLDLLSSINSNIKDLIITRNGELRDELKDKINMEVIPYLNTEYLGFLVDKNIKKDIRGISNKKNPFLNKDIRKAINYSIDREILIKYLRNNIGEPAYKGFIPPVMLGKYADQIEGYRFDPIKAQQHLAKAGFPNGKGLPEIILYMSDISMDLCEGIQSQLKSAGFKVKLQKEQTSSMRQWMADSKLFFFYGQWIADYPDPETFLTVFWSKNPAPPNYTRFNNKAFDDLYDKALLISDPDERKKLYVEMDKIMLEEAPMVPLYYDEIINFTQKNVQGLKVTPSKLLILKETKIIN